MAHDDKREVVDVGADWSKIKTEYITTDTSYRKLAQKYGVSTTQICNVGREEGWVQLREQHLNKTVAKSLNAIASQQAARAARIAGAGDRLLDRVVQLLESDEEAMLDTGVMRDVSVVLKNLKDIQMIRSEADVREQEARIDKLRKEAQKKDDNREITVVISAEAEDYCG